jgi:hypothetical protein
MPPAARRIEIMMKRIVLALSVLFPGVASAQYMDGLPAAPSVSSTDIFPICQGGTAGRPGTCATRKATVAQIQIGSLAPFLASPTPIGSVAPNTGAFTTLGVGTTGTALTWQANTLYGGNGSTFTAAPGAQAVTSYPFYVNGNLGGTSDRVWDFSEIVVNGDNLQSPGSTGGVNWLQINGNVNAGFTGKRAALDATLNITGTNGSVPDDNSRQWQAGIFTTSIHANQGGVGFSGNSAGFVYGGADQMWAFSGATYLSGVVGRETDVGIQTGASAAQRTGMQVVAFYNQQGNYDDSGYKISATSGAPGFQVGWEVQGGTSYAIGSTGTILGYLPPKPGTLAGISATYMNPASALGIDLSGTEQTTAALRTTGGAAITGTGALDAQSLKVSTSGATVSVDAIGAELASVSLTSASGGAGYKTTDHLYDPITGSILSVSSVNGSGAITGYGIVTPGHYVGSAPSSPVTLYGGTGTGATVTMTWTTATTLALQPSGGVIKAGGPVQYASASTGSGTQTFTNSPCTGLTSEKWIQVQITGQTGTFYVPACQ